MWARQELRNLEEPTPTFPTKWRFRPHLLWCGCHKQVAFWRWRNSQETAAAATLWGPLGESYFDTTRPFVDYHVENQHPHKRRKDPSSSSAFPVSFQCPLLVMYKIAAVSKEKTSTRSILSITKQGRGIDLELRGNILIIGTADNFQICISYPDFFSILQTSGCLFMDVTKTPKTQPVFFIYPRADCCQVR